jgi:3-oxoacyl-[acyl-carrier-protein] synthase III
MSSSDIYINSTAYYLGPKSMNVDDSAAAGDLVSTAEALKQAGFNTHHMCPPEISVYDLASGATRALMDGMANGSERLRECQAILYSTCLPMNGNIGSYADYESSRDVKHLMDFPASHLQSDFDMNEAMVMGLNQQACTSMISTLRVARALLISDENMDQALCLTADRFPPGALYEQSYNLISDGAAACMVSRRPEGYRIIGCHHITNGAMAQATDDETTGFYFNYTHQLITETLKRCGLEMDDIRWIISQNTNFKAWQILSSLLHFDRERVLAPSMAEVGHCISGDNIINLNYAEAMNCMESGDKILMNMAGFGLNWACIILEKV